ncbi:hypothetical protein RJ639_019474 [Escallonia herrerae]|uniref:Transposase n=1 Tax=Escallonia herrerae TaxID=1293975 RepID=A0AA88V8C8_9ASTE|nr:hypothetical protein RJ639_019474 [Escallonia herrerae]
MLTVGIGSKIRKILESFGDQPISRSAISQTQTPRLITVGIGIKDHEGEIRRHNFGNWNCTKPILNEILGRNKNFSEDRLLDHGEVNHGEVQGEGNTPLNDVDNRDPVHEVEVDRMPELVNDVLRNRLQDDPCTKVAKFEKYMNEANQELYPGCKSETKLSFIVWLFNLKCTSKWSDKSFDKLIDKLKVIIPAGEQLPANYYEIRKLIGDLGFSYEKIDVCPNDCMLYWKENNKKRSCSVCKEPRWKTVQGKPDDMSVVQTSKSKRHKVAVKQLWHFSLTQALQRMYMSPETAIDMFDTKFPAHSRFNWTTTDEISNVFFLGTCL